MSDCPRCAAVLTPGQGVVSEDVCPRCGGRFLPPEITQRVVVDELGVDREVLREIASLFSGLKIPCPGCRSFMHPLRLRGVHVDLCFSCGGLWLDAGELLALSQGRHAEIGGRRPLSHVDVHPLPVVVGHNSALITLGRGPAIVVLDQLQPPTQPALARVFALTDGLTDGDAQLLSRHCQGVVAEGLSATGAQGLQSLLAREGIGASVVEESVFKLPLVIQCSDVDVNSDQIVARLHTGPPFSIPWAEVVAVVSGVVRRERLEPRPEIISPVLFGTSSDRWGPDSRTELSHQMVASDDVIVELLQVGAVCRRLRVVPSPKKELAHQQRALCIAAVDANVPVGRGPATSSWLRYRRVRELERELAWVAWRAARWPAG